MNAKPTAGGARTNERDFSDLFNQYHTSLCYFAEGVLKDRSRAKDAVATVFEALWNNGRWNNLQSPGAYLYQAVFNACQKIERSSKTREKYHTAADSASPKMEETVLERIYQAEVYRELFMAIGKLPDQCRQVIYLSYKEGLKVDEIARAMNISPSTVKTQRARGIRLLKNLISNNAFALLFLLIKF